MPFCVRVGTPADEAFVHDSWAQCARDAEGHRQGWTFANQKAMQRGILAWPHTRVTVAHPEDDPETIMGWAVSGDARTPRTGEAPTSRLYFVFARFQARKLGIARLLLGELLTAPRVFYGARLPRVCKHCARVDCRTCPDPDRWEAHPLGKRIPRGWHYVPTINFQEP